MVIVIASDSHGSANRLRMLELAYPDADLYLHAGDLSENAAVHEKWHCVKGESEKESAQLSETLTIPTDFGSIFMIHGHQLDRRNRAKEAAQLAVENNCQIAVFGHSHQPDIETISNVLVINPGSLFRNRDGKSTYAIVEMNASEKKSRLMFYFDLFACKIPEKSGGNIY